ncbi:MAG: hypothetical protein JSW52_03475 [Candidatus Coatesbacteria bacterium]|nr:MAG: hypothetical protein JSW52_03475 [Candidatus Coatesbacteria bacterium]
MVSMVPLPGGRYDDVFIIARGVTNDDRVAAADAARRALAEGAPVGYVLIDEADAPAIAAEPALLAAAGEGLPEDAKTIGRQLAAMLHRAEGCLAAARAEVKAGRVWSAVLAAAGAVEHAIEAAVLAKGEAPVSPKETVSRFYKLYIESAIFEADYADWLAKLIADRAVAERTYLLTVAPKDMAADVERATEIVMSIKVHLAGEGFLPTERVG